MNIIENTITGAKNLIEFLLDPRGELIRDSMQNFEKTFSSGVANEGMQNSLVMLPSAFAPDVWNMVQSVANTVMVPIAGIILTYIMCMELIDWIQDQNALHNVSGVITKLMWFIVKVGIGVLLVEKAGEITIGAFDLGVWIVNHSIADINIASGAVSVNMQSFYEQLKEMPFINLFGVYVISCLGYWIVKIIAVLIHAIVLVRIITIYIFASVGSVPYSTMLSKHFGNIGQNYIKNLFALAFQGLFLLIALAIYPILVATLVSGGDPLSALGNLILVSVAEGIIVFKSNSIAKSIFSAQ